MRTVRRPPAGEGDRLVRPDLVDGDTGLEVAEAHRPIGRADNGLQLPLEGHAAAGFPVEMDLRAGGVEQRKRVQAQQVVDVDMADEDVDRTAAGQLSG